MNLIFFTMVLSSAAMMALGVINLVEKRKFTGIVFLMLGFLNAAIFIMNIIAIAKAGV